MHREALRVLAEALIELPARTQLAFSLHRVEGRPLREVAERLDVSVARAQQLVKAAMIHATRRLRERST
jgi:RNA polymerase sigma-70 factor (ECF subfamily)